MFPNMCPVATEGEGKSQGSRQGGVEAGKRKLRSMRACHRVDRSRETVMSKISRDISATCLEPSQRLHCTGKVWKISYFFASSAQHPGRALAWRAQISFRTLGCDHGTIPPLSHQTGALAALRCLNFEAVRRKPQTSETATVLQHTSSS